MMQVNSCEKSWIPTGLRASAEAVAENSDENQSQIMSRVHGQVASIVDFLSFIVIQLMAIVFVQDNTNQSF